ncbi:MAG: hypothetical protein WC967_10615 [Balneolaceae bacterium]
MKIKAYINNIAALVTVLMLVGGFQMSTSTTNSLIPSNISLDTVLGIEEAYAGPCGRRGCNGSENLCTSYTVLEIRGIQITRYCSGIKKPIKVE